MTTGTAESFDRIYATNEWGYGSGVGSLPLNNIKYMEFVQDFMAKNQVSSVVDLGCGDWQFSRFIDWSSVQYLGLDVVPDVVDANARRFTRQNIRFEQLHDVEQVPGGDLLLCKDVFQHLSNEMVRTYLSTLKERFRYLLITNDEGPGEPNRDIAAGEWRPLRLDRSPFGELAPIVLSWTVTWGGWAPTYKCTALISTPQ